MTRKVPAMTIGDVIDLVEASDLNTERRRDMISALKRICEMTASSPSRVAAEPESLRKLLASIRPAAHGISAKSFANMRSCLNSALQLACAVEPIVRGGARRDELWGPLLAKLAGNKRLSNGLAAFAAWSSAQGLSPLAVDDAIVQRFVVHLTTLTLHPKPHDVARQVPIVWNEAAGTISGWPPTRLQRISFRPPSKHLRLEDLRESFRRDLADYLAMRADPDLFDDRPNSPRRPLAASTLRQQREHLRLAASILSTGDVRADVTCLADLVQPPAFKAVLRYYHRKAHEEPNAFAIGIAKTIFQVARFHVRAAPEQLAELKRLASKLPDIPFDLTPKNKALLRQLESERLRANLLFLPEQLAAEVSKSLKLQKYRLVDAQIALAVDILLAIPLRPQNLVDLCWAENFSEPNGPNRGLIIYIPARQTKSKRHDITIELPADVSRRIHWYRTHMLTRFADPCSYLFVTREGTRKAQETLSQQMVETIARLVGIHMTPHQFRHFAAASYLDEHPEDFETARSLLGHAWSKTTRVYAGSSGKRATRAYNAFLLKQREKLRLMRPVVRKSS